MRRRLYSMILSNYFPASRSTLAAPLSTLYAILLGLSLSSFLFSPLEKNCVLSCKKLYTYILNSEYIEIWRNGHPVYKRNALFLDEIYELFHAQNCTLIYWILKFEETWYKNKRETKRSPGIYAKRTILGLHEIYESLFHALQFSHC